MSVSLTHAELEGTLAGGTSRGDGSGEVLKSLGWRWGRSIGAWFVPRSRYRPAQRELIERTAAALREAGLEVVVSIDATGVDRAEVERLRADAEQGRAERLAGRAARHEATAVGLRTASAEISDGIPLGQPILVGHHSEGRHRRTLERIERLDRAEIEHTRQARDDGAAAARAAGAADGRHEPLTVARRVDRQATEVRRMERSLGVAATDPVEGLAGRLLQRREELDVLRRELEYWQGVRAAQLRSGEAADFGAGNVKVGDLVRIRGQWRKVARANRTTVTVETGYSWTDRAPWFEVTAHRSA